MSTSALPSAALDPSDSPPLRPSAKALGKRRAVSPHSDASDVDTFDDAEAVAGLKRVGAHILAAAPQQALHEIYLDQFGQLMTHYELQLGAQTLGGGLFVALATAHLQQRDAPASLASLKTASTQGNLRHDDRRAAVGTLACLIGSRAVTLDEALPLMGNLCAEAPSHAGRSERAALAERFAEVSLDEAQKTSSALGAIYRRAMLVTALEKFLGKSASRSPLYNEARSKAPVGSDTFDKDYQHKVCCAYDREATSLEVAAVKRYFRAAPLTKQLVWALEAPRMPGRIALAVAAFVGVLPVALALFVDAAGISIGAGIALGLLWGGLILLTFLVQLPFAFLRRNARERENVDREKPEQKVPEGLPARAAPPTPSTSSAPSRPTALRRASL